MANSFFLNKCRALSFVLLGCAVGLMSACDENTYVQGKRIYEANCMNCHMADGTGLNSLIPTLAESEFLRQHRNELVCVVYLGSGSPLLRSESEVLMPMPGLKELKAADMTNLVNYMLTNWGNDLPPVTLDDVRAKLDACD